MPWWRRKEREQDLDRELRDHLELEAAEREESGLSAEEARYAAAIIMVIKSKQKSRTEGN